MGTPGKRLVAPKVVETLDQQVVRFRFEFLDAGKRSGHGMDHQPHRHQVYELFYFVQGGGQHEIDFHQLPIETGAIHWVKPGQVHFLQREASCWGFVLQFDRAFFQTEADVSWFDGLWLQSENQVGNQAILFDAMGRQEAEACMRMWQHFPANHATRTIDLTRLKLLLEHAERCYLSQHSKSSKQNSVYTGLFDRFLRLLDSQFYKEHRLEFYTERLVCSKQKLLRETKRFAGKSPLGLLHQRICSEAKSMLTFTDLSNKEIAFALGFEDPAYFSRFIKKQCGITPEKLRQQLREKYQ